MKADDLYTKVTNDIIARLEDGAGGWTKPWFDIGISGNPRSLSSGKAYRGINWVILVMAQEDKGYTSNQWGTFKQWLSLSTDDQPVCVRKGEKSTSVFLWKPGTEPGKARKAEDPNAKAYLLALTFNVFNRDQVDGLPAEVAPSKVLNEHERWDAADDYFRTIGADVREDGDRAYYAPAQDYIAVPKLGQFANPDHFYTTMAHEHAHWTGHKTRLDRDLHNRFGSEAYAAEELIAELSAAFWGAQMGLEPAIRQDHAAYLKSWLSVLKADKRAIVSAASQAQKAVDHLNKLAGVTAAVTADVEPEMAVA